MNNKNNISYAYTAAVIYSIISGLSFIFGKIALGGGSPLDVLAHRFTASFVAVLAVVLSGAVKAQYDRRKIVKILPLALLYPLCFFGFQTYGLGLASAVEAGILTATIPIFTLIFATLFLKEESTTFQKASIMVSVVGVIFITVMKGSAFEAKSFLGVILLLLSALSFSGYAVLARVLTKDYSGMELSIIMITISFIVFNALALVKNMGQGTLGAFFRPFSDINYTLSIIYLGVLSTLVTSFLTNFVLSKLEASKMGVFANLGTIVSIVAGVLLLKEPLYYYHVIGSILIILGVIGANMRKKG